jgi:hypothetical protein
MTDFNERLRARKDELRADKSASESTVQLSPSELQRLRVESKVQDWLNTLKTWAIGAVLLLGLFSFFIVRDWWGFIGSKEYSEWKTRTEKE